MSTSPALKGTARSTFGGGAGETGADGAGGLGRGAGRGFCAAAASAIESGSTATRSITPGQARMSEPRRDGRVVEEREQQCVQAGSVAVQRVYRRAQRIRRRRIRCDQLELFVLRIRCAIANLDLLEAAGGEQIL